MKEPAAKRCQHQIAELLPKAGLDTAQRLSRLLQRLDRYVGCVACGRIGYLRRRRRISWVSLPWLVDRLRADVEGIKAMTPQECAT